VTTQLQLIIIIIIIISVINERLNARTTGLLQSKENATHNSFPWRCLLVGVYITVCRVHELLLLFFLLLSNWPVVSVIVSGKFFKTSVEEREREAYSMQHLRISSGVSEPSNTLFTYCVYFTCQWRDLFRELRGNMCIFLSAGKSKTNRRPHSNSHDLCSFSHKSFNSFDTVTAVCGDMWL
jgi:hypothetical protein